MTGTAPSDNVEQLLAALRAGERAALDRLFEIVYSELRHLASAQIARSPKDETLSTTALVNEAYVRFAASARLSAGDRNHFYSLAARAMRQILIDHSRKRLTQRRGGDVEILPLADWDHPEELDLERVLSVDAALSKLEALDGRLSRIVEFRVFAGLSLEEIAAAGEQSISTLKRDWRKARAFLLRELGQGSPPSTPV